MRTALAASAAVLLALPAAPVRADDDAFPRKYEVRTVKDVAYCDGADADKAKHQLDLYLPKGAKDFPVMLFIHGGSWRHGDKDDFSFGPFGVYSDFGSFYARRGIGVAVINYRLSPEVKHPEHVKDAARAFAWVHKHIGEYGGRADQLFAAGHSAGGHLAALLATDDQWLKAEGLTPKAIKGVICLSGVFDLPDDLLPEVFGDAAATHREASPIRHVHAGLPPFLLLCAEDDLSVCNQKCVDAFAAAVRDKGGQVDTLQIKDTDHPKIILHAAVPGDPATKAILKFIAGLTTARAAAPPAAIQETLDVRYSGGPDGQALDVFAPKGASNRPVVLFVHGGAWMFGDKNMFGYYRGVGRFFARHGAVALSINYRLAPAAKHPAQVEDVARAFAWARRHARAYGGDPDRIFLCGHSAGGHLVALLATDESYLKDPNLGLTDEDRAALKGVMAVSGVYRIPTPDEFTQMTASMIHGLLQTAGRPMLPTATLLPTLTGPSRLLNPFRMVFGNDPAAAAKAAPLTHVHKGLPPFLVLYAARELPYLDGMATDFAQALRDAGDSVDLRRIPDCDHNFILFKLDRPGDPAAAALLDFLGRYGGVKS